MGTWISWARSNEFTYQKSTLYEKENAHDDPKSRIASKRYSVVTVIDDSLTVN